MEAGREGQSSDVPFAATPAGRRHRRQAGKKKFKKVVLNRESDEKTGGLCPPDQVFVTGSALVGLDHLLTIWPPMVPACLAVMSR
jgi:hypothetical protein